jgi:hypothetical protein
MLIMLQLLLALSLSPIQQNQAFSAEIYDGCSQRGLPAHARLLSRIGPLPVETGQTGLLENSVTRAGIVYERSEIRVSPERSRSQIDVFYASGRAASSWRTYIHARLSMIGAHGRRIVTRRSGARCYTIEVHSAGNA